MNWRDHISVNPDICHGKACIRGTRVLVSVIHGNLAAKISPVEILKSYPTVRKEAIDAAVSSAAELVREQLQSCTPTSIS